MIGRVILMSVSVMLLSACAKIGLFAANFPSNFGDTKIYTDVSFGPEDWQKADIYVPPHAPDEKLDVVVFFYGGRWTDGVKEEYRFAGSALASKKFIAVLPDYRKYPDVKFPDFVHDGAKAVAWVSDNIAQYGGNPARIHISGHSSGAHIGSLITVDERYLKAEGKSRDDVVRSFAGLAGPYAFIPEDPDLIDMFGPPENYPQMQVSTFVDKNDPPMMFLYGGKDTHVHMINIDRVKAQMDKIGTCARINLYPDIDHIWIVGSMSWLGQGKASVLDDMAAFFQESGTPASNLCPPK